MGQFGESSARAGAGRIAFSYSCASKVFCFIMQNICRTGVYNSSEKTFAGWWGTLDVFTVFTPARQGLRPGISNSSPTGRQRLQISAVFLQLSARVKCLVAATDWLSSSHLVYKASVGY